ncbi:YqjF family protein [Marinococcus halophilus]|uniref:YqjF family protein n=1 Tax=Marinococcus halophilus TaxID=1371 RepID=UPI0009A7D26A|nr:DUF2071 domain-containing protein [Marinococcus halophilus]
MYEDILNTTAHRRTSLPRGPWVMSQRWSDMLFLHCPVRAGKVEQYLPPGLELDTFDGEAWITILPFRVTDMHIRSLPSFPYLHKYLELNVRTYVRRGSTPGIFFFSLDADKLLNVLGARLASLPYYYASMRMHKETEAFHCTSRRRRKEAFYFEGTYRASSDAYCPLEGTLDHWLLERYYAWSSVKNGLVEIGIHHTPWEVQDAQADVQTVSLPPLAADELALSRMKCHFAPEKRALFWSGKRILFQR